MTGRNPVSDSCISKAAERVELDGQQHTGFLVMISPTRCLPDHEQANTRLFRLQRLDVLVQISDPQLHFRAMALAHAPE